MSTTNEEWTALAAIEADWNLAAKPWNPQALAGVYAEDALFFGGRPGHAVGSCGIRDYFASYDGVIESGTMQLVDQQVIKLAPGTYLAQGYADFSFVLSNKGPTKSLLRTTLVVVLREGRWKIRQHHFSSQPAVPPLGDS